jgi:LysM repeat protein
LGGVELHDFEKPDNLALGGKQALAVKEFPGGNVSIQDMGPTYRPITWTGMFIGSDAYDRMMSIGLMRTAGSPVILETEKFTMSVMIEEFLPDVKTLNRIPFSITLRRVVDERIWKNKSSTDPLVYTAPSTPTVQTPAQIYVVKQGDTLPKIAFQLKGDPAAWEQIYLDNQSVLVNGPHNLNPGMVIKIA